MENIDRVVITRFLDDLLIFMIYMSIPIEINILFGKKCHIIPEKLTGRSGVLTIDYLLLL